jgi:hypothetical protein
MRMSAVLHGWMTGMLLYSPSFWLLSMFMPRAYALNGYVYAAERHG